MPENISKAIEQVQAYLRGLSLPKKIAAGTIVALGVVAVMVVSMAGERENYRILYSDLQSDEVRSVTRKLGELGIPHKVLDGETTVTVPREFVDSARLELAKEGIPGQDVVGFEKFDGSTIGMSSYVQRIQYVRAVQGELIRSIERLESVKRARVHISIPPKKTFLEEEDPPKASVILELKRGQRPSKSEVNGIAHLVASAVEGLKVAQISIVDTTGAFLHRPGADDETAGKPSALLELQRSIEREYERRVEDILSPVLGLGKVRAKVTVEVDPSRVNMTEETFNPDRAAPRTSVRNEESTTGSRPNPIGIPGSRSNLPGAEVQNPPVPMANTNTQRSTENTNFVIPRKVTVTSRPSGSIKRLTVAVVVDGNYRAVPGQGLQFEPRSEEELLRLRDLVANAIGYDEGRRDSITISSMPFARTEFDAPPEEVPRGPWWSEQVLLEHLIRNGLIVLLGLGFLLLVVRPLVKWARPSGEEPDLFPFPRTVADLERGTALSAGAALALTNPGEAIDAAEPLDKREEQELRERIVKKLQESPRKGFQIVQDWLEEGIGPKPVNG